MKILPVSDFLEIVGFLILISIVLCNACQTIYTLTSGLKNKDLPGVHDLTTFVLLLMHVCDLAYLDKKRFTVIH